MRLGGSVKGWVSMSEAGGVFERLGESVRGWVSLSNIG